MREFIYHLRFAFHMWANVRDMSMREAWNYPCDRSWGDGDPAEDAYEEVDAMRTDSLQ